MEILDAPEVSTQEWVGGVRLHQPADWSDVPPELASNRGKRWNHDPSDRPWLDKDDAEQSIASLCQRGLITSDEGRLLAQFATDGYCVLKGAIEESELGLIDGYVRDLDGVWTASEAWKGLQLSSVHIEGRAPGPVDHAELLSLPLTQRLALRGSHSWRIHYFHPYSAAAMGLAKARRLLRMSYLVLQQNPVLINTTCFKYSSQSSPHLDVHFYHLEPAHLVGVWLACEDVKSDAGPLIVFPGTHRMPNWSGFQNYPQTNYRTCHSITRKQHDVSLMNSIADVKGVSLQLEKGDAVILNGWLIHSAEQIKERGDKTRACLVMHYTITGAHRIDEVEGPFNY